MAQIASSGRITFEGSRDSTPLHEIRTHGGYEEFAELTRRELFRQWFGRGADSKLKRSLVTLDWLECNYAALWPDRGTETRDEIMAAILLDLTVHAAARAAGDESSVDRRRHNLLSLGARRCAQEKLDAYLTASNYDPRTNTQRPFKDLIEVFKLSRRLAYTPVLNLPREVSQEARTDLIGILSEYKLLKALHKLDYDSAYFTQAKLDMEGYDIATPYMDPKHWFPAQKFIQVKTVSQDERLREEPSDKPETIEIWVPWGRNGCDKFSLNPGDDELLKIIMNSYILPFTSQAAMEEPRPATEWTSENLYNLSDARTARGRDDPYWLGHIAARAGY